MASFIFSNCILFYKKYQVLFAKTFNAKMLGMILDKLKFIISKSKFSKTFQVLKMMNYHKSVYQRVASNI